MKIKLLITFLCLAVFAVYLIFKKPANNIYIKADAANTLAESKAVFASNLLQLKKSDSFIIDDSVQKENFYVPPTKSLRDAYKDYFPIGAAITPEVDLNDKAVVQFLKTQFGSLTSKQAMQPSRIHPKEFKYNWTIPDMFVNFAQENNMLVRGHCLVYSSRAGHMPNWFYSDNGHPASKELVLKRMKDHITSVVSRYQGKVYCWDVVNEAISPKKGEYFNSNDSLYTILGEDYVAKAFEFAHAADPKAKLFYNDNFDNHSPIRRDYIFNLLKKLKEQGVPINGIGMQCHLGIDGISKQYLQETIDLFHSIGLEFQITELDISIYPRYIKNNELLAEKEDYTSTIQDKQADTYKTIFEVCRENKEKVTGITFWGSFDNDNERNSLTKKLGKKNYPFLFDKNMNAKKAVDGITNF